MRRDLAHQAARDEQHTIPREHMTPDIDGTRILVVGAGAVGSYIGGWLARDGRHDVVFADARTEQVDAFRSGGLTVEGPHEPFVAHPRAYHLHESQRLALEPRFDLAIIAMKAYDTAWSAKFAERFVSETGYFVSAQNCLTDDAIAAMVGAERCVGLIMSSIAVRLDGIGKVQRAGTKRRRDMGHVVFRAGEHDGSESPRIKSLIAMLDPIDAGKTTTNLSGERWAKLCQNSMGNPVVAATMCGMATLAETPRARELQIRLAGESAAVGLAEGRDVVAFGGAPAQQWADSVHDGAVFEELASMMASSPGGGSGDWYPSMGQDIQNGRPSEIDYMNGEVLRRGERVGVDVPVTRAMVDAVRGVDRGDLAPELSNADAVLTAAGY